MLGGPVCPPWEYEDVPGHKGVVQAEAAELIRRIYSASASELMAIVKETRPIHGKYFTTLTPPGFEYYAGNFRGSSQVCLRDCFVGIRSDGRVGHHPALVSASMSGFAAQIDDTFDELDFLSRVSASAFSDAEKLVRRVQLIAALLVYFLEIHPYLNGNGHMGRMMVVASLKRYGHYIPKWPIDPRPNPPYLDLIRAYRDGHQNGLVAYILNCL